MEIKSISQKIFRTAPGKIESNQTNPFGVNFKGNIINADVFQPVKINLVEKAANKSKMLTSAIVGSINDVNQAIKSRLDSVMAVGRRIKEKSVAAWKFLNEAKLSINFSERVENSIKFIWPNQQYRVENLMELSPKNELRDMLKLAIATR